MNVHRLMSQLLLMGAVACMVAFFVMTNGNPQQETILAGISIGLIAVAILAEKFAPFRREWAPDAGETKTDIALFVIVFGALDSALKWLTPFAIITIASFYQPHNTLPFWIEIPIVVLAIELMAWLSHLIHHRFRPLWVLHAMHHAPEKLYTLNNFRFHPINHIINHVFMLAPVLALGFSAEAVLLYTVASMPILILQHSNIDFDFGKLDWFFNTNVVHRYHHSIEQHEGMSNLGRATVFWDHVFGTYNRPDENKAPEKLGLFRESLRKYPQAHGIMRQIAWPFTKDCCA